MAIDMRAAEVDVPPYPEILHALGQPMHADHARLLDLAYLHLCDAWEFQVRALYASWTRRQDAERRPIASRAEEMFRRSGPAVDD